MRWAGWRLGRIITMAAIIGLALGGGPTPSRAQATAATPLFAGDYFADTTDAAGPSLDHIGVIFGGGLDLTPPDPTRFSLTVNGDSRAVASATVVHVLYGGFLSLVRLDLSTSIRPVDSGSVEYDSDPNLPGVRLTTGGVPIDTFSLSLDLNGPAAFEPILALSDGSRGADRITVFLGQPLTTGALPDATRFSVQRTGAGGQTDLPLVSGVASIYPGYGVGALELTLDRALAWNDTSVTVAFDAAGSTPLENLAGTQMLASFSPLGVTLNLPNTPLQPDPVSVPLATEGGPTVASVTFPSVTGAGTTSIEAIDPATLQAVPGGYSVDPAAAIYDISTTATYGGQVTVCLSYAGYDPEPTSLLHYASGSWVDITTSKDATNQLICGTTATLSPFALARVAYHVLGFSQPLNDPESPLSVFKKGSTIPVKFALTYPDGTRIPDATASEIASACRATIQVAPIGVTSQAVDEAATALAANVGSCFRYDATSHQFVFNLGTAGLTARLVYRVTAIIVDQGGQSAIVDHSVTFATR
jgi:hypothetical protein